MTVGYWIDINGKIEKFKRVKFSLARLASGETK